MESHGSAFLAEALSSSEGIPLHKKCGAPGIMGRLISPEESVAASGTDPRNQTLSLFLSFGTCSTGLFLVMVDNYKVTTGLTW